MLRRQLPLHESAASRFASSRPVADDAATDASKSESAIALRPREPTVDVVIGAVRLAIARLGLRVQLRRDALRLALQCRNLRAQRCQIALQLREVRRWRR